MPQGQSLSLQAFFQGGASNPGLDLGSLRLLVDEQYFVHAPQVERQSQSLRGSGARFDAADHARSASEGNNRRSVVRRPGEYLPYFPRASRKDHGVRRTRHLSLSHSYQFLVRLAERMRNSGLVVPP